MVESQTSYTATTQKFGRNETELENVQPYDPPIFIKGLQSQLFAKEGETVKFDCKFTPANDPNMEIIWLFNDHPLQQGTNETFSPDFYEKISKS